MSLLTRTYSSPNLKSRHRGSNVGSNSRYAEYQDHNHKLDREQDEDFYVIGDRVFIDGYRRASVAYFGEVEFALGDWVGVVLDEPTGNHSGKIHGREYFQCAPFQGLFVRPHRVSRVPDSALGSSASSSRVSTPMPASGRYYSSNNSNRINSILRSRSTDTNSPGQSTLDSYYYDEDYRPDKRPTLESLTRKLRSIDDGDQQVECRTRESRPTRERTKFERLDSLEPEGPEIPQRSSSILKSRLSNSFRSSPNPTRFRSSSVAPTTRTTTTNSTNNRTFVDVPTITKSLDREPVFNFRPKREQLNLHKIADSGNGSSPTSSRVSRSTSSAASGDQHRSNMSYSMYRSATPNPSGRASVDLTSEPPRKGDRVTVRSERGELTGILRFMGETEFATGEWAGVELDRAEGKNDGCILGVRYFHCPTNYGLFVPATRVKKYRPSSAASYSTASSPVMPKIFDSVRSTITSPPPVSSHYSASRYNYGASGSGSPYSSSYESPINRPLSSAYSSSSLYQDPYNSNKYSTGRTYEDYDRPLKTNSNLLNSASSTSLLSRPSSSSSSYLDSYRYKPSKFDDADIEYQLRKTLNRTSNLLRPTGANSYGGQQTNWSSYASSQRPKSIKYTFSSSKYDGNPIARRTVEYH